MCYQIDEDAFMVCFYFVCKILKFQWIELSGATVPINVSRNLMVLCRCVRIEQ